MILTKPTKSDIERWLDQAMIAKGGGVFVPSNDRWRPDPTTYSANVVAAKKSVPDECQLWLVAAIAFRAKEVSARSLNGLVGALKYCGDKNLNILDVSNVVTIQKGLSRSQFSMIRSFLKFWADLELDVAPDTGLIAVLYEQKSKRRSGCPVESVDPVKGPFTVHELKGIFDWVNDAYAGKKILFSAFVLIRLLIATGARRRQIQQLVFGDIISDGQKAVINMPKAKEREFEYRKNFQRFYLSNDLRDVLASYKNYTLERLKNEQPTVCWDKAIKNVPILRAIGRTWDKAVILDDPNLYELENYPQERFHMSDPSMKGLLNRIEKMSGFPISERTLKTISISSHRFRYTLGSDMARENYGSHAIAAALGHNGIRSVGRYIKTSPQMGKRLDSKMKTELALVVNAFQGEIIPKPDDNTKESTVAKTIYGGSGAIATCGSGYSCHLDAPFSCYTCSKFQPWVEGPHEEVLTRLETRRDRVVLEGGDSAVVTSFDRPILAVAQVIEKIRNIKKSSSG